MSTLPAPITSINHLLTLEKITPADIEDLNPLERQNLAEAANKRLAQLTGTERDDFLEKIDPILPAHTKTAIWEHNHSLINGAVSGYMRQNGVMPTKSAIARETGLSRQTIIKHFAEYKKHPDHTAEMEQFKFMATNVLASVGKHALNGDIKAARLYFEMVGATNRQSRTCGIIHEQNNYIQVNNTKLSQQNLEQLSAEQLSQIENIIRNNG